MTTRYCEDNKLVELELTRSEADAVAVVCRSLVCESHKAKMFAHSMDAACIQGGLKPPDASWECSAKHDDGSKLTIPEALHADTADVKAEYSDTDGVELSMSPQMAMILSCIVGNEYSSHLNNLFRGLTKLAIVESLRADVQWSDVIEGAYTLTPVSGKEHSS